VELLSRIIRNQRRQSCIVPHAATTAQFIFQRNVPRWIRTTDLQLRRLLLYPTELSGQAIISITHLNDS
jgi:hypothetical protein